MFFWLAGLGISHSKARDKTPFASFLLYWRKSISLCFSSTIQKKKMLAIRGCSPLFFIPKSIRDQALLLYPCLVWGKIETNSTEGKLPTPPQEGIMDWGSLLGAERNLLKGGTDVRTLCAPLGCFYFLAGFWIFLQGILVPIILLNHCFWGEVIYKAFYFAMSCWHNPSFRTLNM